MSQEPIKKDPPISRFLEKFGNVFALNILWIVFSIPIITIGASTTALYSMSMKMVKNEEDAIFKGFKKAFKDNFKQATLAWLIVLGIAVIIWAELFVVNIETGTLSVFYQIIALLEVVLLLFVLCYLFPLIARFNNSLLNQFKNALLLSISNLWSTMKIMMAWLMPLYASTVPIIFYYVWFLWLVIGVGLIAFGTSHTILKVLKLVDDKQARIKEEKEEAKDKKNTVLKKGDISRRASLVTKNIEGKEDSIE